MINIDELIAAGFTLCHIPAGKKGDKTMSHGWQNRPITKYDGRSNVGLIHGGQTCAVDIDNLELAVLAFAAVGLDLSELLLSKPQVIGNPARAKVLFRLPEGAGLKRVALSTKEAGCVLELRTDATQDVIFGTHPDGYQYKVIGDLLDMPMIPDQLLLVWQYWTEAKEAMLEALPGYVPKVDTVKRTRPNYQQSGESVIDAFNVQYSPFSLLIDNGYELKGNRLLSPNNSSGEPGIIMQQDSKHFWSFGASDFFCDGLKHDAFDVFKHFECNDNETDAVRMAAGLLGMTRKSEENNHGAEVADILLHKAKKVEDSEARFVRVVEAEQHFEVRPQATVDPVPPVPFVQELIAWIHQSNGSGTTPVNALTQAALSFCSAMFARRYAFSKKSPIHLYLAVTTDSSVQMAALQSIVSSAIIDCKDRGMIRSEIFGSHAPIKKSLIASPRLFFATTAYASSIAFASRQYNSTSYDASVDTMVKIFTGKKILVDKDITEKIDKNEKNEFKDIIAPALTILASMAQQDLYKISKKVEYNRGTLQQLLIAPGGEEISFHGVENDDDDVFPESLINHVMKAKPHILQPELHNKQPELKIIHSEVDFKDYESGYKEIEKLYPQWHGIPIGWKQIFKRICGVLAVANDLECPIVTKEIADWANQWVLHHLRWYMDTVYRVGSDSGDMATSQKVEDCIYGFGDKGGTLRDIRVSCWTFRNMPGGKANELIEELIFDKVIVGKKIGNAMKYFHSKNLIDNSVRKV